MNSLPELCIAVFLRWQWKIIIRTTKTVHLPSYTYTSLGFFSSNASFTRNLCAGACVLKWELSDHAHKRQRVNCRVQRLVRFVVFYLRSYGLYASTIKAAIPYSEYTKNFQRNQSSMKPIRAWALFTYWNLETWTPNHARFHVMSCSNRTHTLPAPPCTYKQPSSQNKHCIPPHMNETYLRKNL